MIVDLGDEVNPFPFDVYKEWADFCNQLFDELKIRKILPCIIKLRMKIILRLLKTKY